MMKVIALLCFLITLLAQSEQKSKSPIKYESCVDAIKEKFADWDTKWSDEFTPVCDVYGGYKMEQRLFKGKTTKYFCVNPRNGALLAGPGDRKNINCSKYVENCKDVKKDKRNEYQPPQCDQNGKWNEKQMLKNKSHFCVEKNTGTKISCDKNCKKNKGTATVMKTDTWWSRTKNLKCDEYGNYKVQQDDGHGVWCADPQTGATMKTSPMRVNCMPEGFVEEYEEYEILSKDPKR